MVSVTKKKVLQLSISMLKIFIFLVNLLRWCVFLSLRLLSEYSKNLGRVEKFYSIFFNGSSVYRVLNRFFLSRVFVTAANSKYWVCMCVLVVEKKKIIFLFDAKKHHYIYDEWWLLKCLVTMIVNRKFISSQPAHPHLCLRLYVLCLLRRLSFPLL